jgi:MarR family 2-MHQ and catechol resistance regulon transcriptional repressor
VLIHVRGAEEGRVTMSKLSTQVALTTGGVTRLVDRMVDAGLVSRQNCPSDRRSVHVILTPRGHAMLGQAIGAHIDGIERHLMAPLNDQDRAALTAALSKLVPRGNC